MSSRQPTPLPQQPAYRLGTAPFYSPLRYPGGKRKLANFIALVLRANNLLDGEYAEVYAGGAGVALSLLFGDYVRRVHINDIDPGVHAFWVSARDHTAELCQLIRDARIDRSEWERQREIQGDSNAGIVELGFSTFYLNRTNRSGIITGGPIGGRDQESVWKMNARFQKDDLIRRIQRIGRWRSRIEVHRLDGAEFLETVAPRMVHRSLLYLDPPYYVKGQEMLYANYYGPNEHARVSRLVSKLRPPWVVSYDDIPEIRELYRGYRAVTYRISYSANSRYAGREVAFFSEGLVIPPVPDPTRLTVADVERLSVTLGSRPRLRLGGTLST
ncbi:MAG: DNA adenine methylase [Candidatus Dormibacteraeota bacterium]|jgi:DNA adenine methylase|nr:DNA adenine methylase [Candidatus Dormibacteraeota bacterium]